MALVKVRRCQGLNPCWPKFLVQDQKKCCIILHNLIGRTSLSWDGRISMIPLRRTQLDSQASFSFSCRCCLHCCRSKKIQVNPFEIARLARNLGISTTECMALYTASFQLRLNFQHRAKLPIRSNGKNRSEPDILMIRDRSYTAVSNRFQTCKGATRPVPILNDY